MIRSNNVDYKNIHGEKHLEFSSEIEEENEIFGRLLR